MRAATVVAAAVAVILLSAALPVESSNSSRREAAAEPTGCSPRPQAYGHAESVSVRHHRVAAVAWPGLAEPTAALRAAVWVATAIIAAASIAVAAAPDQAQRYRRPGRAGSKRWEAGWAGRGPPDAGC